MIVRESIGFQRGMSDREIRDVLIGWKKSQFLINPYTNIVYIFMGEWQEEDYAELFSIGHLRTKKTESHFAGKEFFQLYRKSDADWKRTNFKSKDKLRPLKEDELGIVKRSLSLEYINKIESKLGIKVIIP